MDQEFDGKAQMTETTAEVFSKVAESPYLLLFFALNALGWMLKKTPCIQNPLIPYILCLVGIPFGILMIGFPKGALIGLIMAAGAIGGHQIMTSWMNLRNDPAPQNPENQPKPTL
jgi:hypothetical protein